MEYDKDLIQNIITEDDVVQSSDETNDENKENMQYVEVIVEKQTRTTPQQMKKLIESAEEITGTKMNKKETNCFWDALTVELNKLGPPFHTSSGWRRVWSMYKSNKKKRTHSGSQVPSSSLLDSDSSIEEILTKLGQIFDSLIEMVNKGDQILGKLNEILNNRNELVSQSGDILQQNMPAGASNGGTYVPFDRNLYKQIELESQSGDISQMEVSVGDNFNVRTNGPFYRILNKLDEIHRNQNSMVGKSGQFDQILDKVNELLNQRTELVSQSDDKLQQAETNGLSAQILNKLAEILINPNENFILGKLSDILDKLK